MSDSVTTAVPAVENRKPQTVNLILFPSGLERDERGSDQDTFPLYPKQMFPLPADSLNRILESLAMLIKPQGGVPSGLLTTWAFTPWNWEQPAKCPSQAPAEDVFSLPGRGVFEHKDHSVLMACSFLGFSAELSSRGANSSI